MGKRKLAMTGRAWNLLRLALIWARKGGAFKRWRLMVMVELKSLRSVASPRSAARIHNGEREFSFDETPVFHFKMHRPSSMRLPRIPCINSVPPVDFDDDDDIVIFGRKKSSLCQSEIMSEEGCEGRVVRTSDEMVVLEGEEEEEGIDLKAEEFIARFYEQMKLQRQVSFLQYNEMLDRSLN